MRKITWAGGGVAGEASHLSVQAFSSTEVMTTMQNGSGNLELIGWLVDGDKVTRANNGTATAGTVQEVALALVGRRAVTAVRNGSNNLLLISWNVPVGVTSIDRLHDSGTLAGEASQIAMTAIGGNMLVTAMRAGSGNLLLISWALNADGSFTRLGDSAPPDQPAQAGAVSLVTVAFIGNYTVVTAVRNGSGNLELIAWKVSTDGKIIHRQDPSGTSAGAVSEIALIPFPGDPTSGGAPGVITAVRNGSGNLEVIGWKVLEGGIGIARAGDTSRLPPSQVPGTASHIAIAPAGGATTYLATMRRGSGDLELIAFDLAANGGWSRVGDLVPEVGTDVTETAVAPFYSRAVSAVRRANFLNLAIWDVSLTNVQAADTAALNQWFTSVLADPTRARQLKGDWMKLLQAELAVTDRQKEHLSLVPAADAMELQKAIAMVVDHGGTIHIERDSERSPGVLVVQPKKPGVETVDFSVGVFHCTFDANCRHWHCGWGPAKKK